MRLLSKKHKITFSAVALVLALVACTNTQWFVGMVYNRADNLIAGEVFEYADFTDQQTQAIHELIDRFHHWHRVTQLPRYAEFLDGVAARMRTGEPLQRAQVRQWLHRVEALAENTGRCHPLYAGTEIMVGLSETQVDQVRAHMEEQYAEMLEEYEDTTDEERLDEFHGDLLKWLNRFQLNPNREEQQRFKQALARTFSLHEVNAELWVRWDADFYRLLRQRHSPEFAARMREHIDAARRLQEDHYPEKVARARAIWTGFFLELLNARIANQDLSFVHWAEKMAANLREVSASVPAQQQGWNVEEYCPA